VTAQRPPGLASLDRLAGTWQLEAVVEGRSMIRGSTTFEWIEDGAFLLQHADAEPLSAEWAEHSPMPTTSLIGFDDTSGEYTMLYGDARRVYRVYRMRLEDDDWRVWRDAPGFNQRFIGSFADGGATINGRWETSPDGSTWELDFEMRYWR
jgi:hypothetical protein